MIECIKATIDEWASVRDSRREGSDCKAAVSVALQPVLGDEIEVKLHYDAKTGFLTRFLSTANSCDRVVVFGSFLTVGEVMQQFSGNR